MEISQFTAHAVALLRDVSLRSLVIFALAGLVCLGLRRASAAVRHALWSVTLISLLCLPILYAALPRWKASVLPVPSPQVSRVSPSTKTLSERPSRAAALAPSVDTKEMTAASEASAPSVLPPVTMASPARTPQPVTVPAPPPGVKPAIPTVKPTAAMWLFGVWLAGMMAVLARTLAGLAAAWRLVRRSRPITSGLLMEAAEDARRSLALARPVSLREGASDAPVLVPMTFGVIRPVVLLPEGAGEWPRERLRVVLLHEMAHIGRRDWLTTMIGQAVCVLYWFHPLAWLALRRLRVEGEQACDDLVLNSGVPAPDYAAHLLDIIRGLTAGRGTLPAVVTMAQPREVVGRLKTILADGQNRRGVGRRGLTLAALTASCLLGPLAAMHPVAATDSTTHSDSLPRIGPRSAPGASMKRTSPMRRIIQWRQTLLASETSPWKATLPNGVQVCLEEVWALNGPDASKMWTGDGALLVDFGHGPLPGYQRNRSTVCNIGVILVFPSDALRHEARVSFAKVGERPGQGTDLGGFDANGTFLGDRRVINTGFQDTFPPAAAKTSLMISVATGSETTLVSGPPERGATRRLPTGEAVTLSRATVRPAAPNQTDGLGDTAQVQFTLPSRFVRDQSEYKISVLGLDGQPLHVPQGRQSYPILSGKSATLLYAFRTGKLPLSHVKEFRLTYRLAHTAIFRDVPLRPNPQSTAPNPGAADMGTTARPAALTTSPSAANADSPWAVTLADGTQVRLVTVMGSDRKRPAMASWAPDGGPRPLVPGPALVTYVPFQTGEPSPWTTFTLGLSTTPPKKFHVAVRQTALVRRGRGDISLALSAGPYTTLVSGSLAHGASQSLPTGEVVTLSRGVTSWRNSPLAGYGHRKLTRITLTLPVRFTTSDYDTKLEALGPDGRPLVFPTYRTAPGGRGLWNFTTVHIFSRQA